MAQFRQSSGNGPRNFVGPDYVSVSVRGGSRQLNHRRSKPASYKIFIGLCVLILSIILSISAFFYFVLQSKGMELDKHEIQDDDIGYGTDFLMDVTRIQKPRELNFGRGSVAHGRDSRYWDKDDRRRDESYAEEEPEPDQDGSVDKFHRIVKNRDKVSLKHDSLDHHKNGLYNEAGRNELKMYEAKYEASLKSTENSTDSDEREHRALEDVDEYDGIIDLSDDQMEESDDAGNDDIDHSSAIKKPHTISIEEPFLVHRARNKKQHTDEGIDEASTDLYGKESFSDSHHAKANSISTEGKPTRRIVPEKRLGSKKK